MSDHAPGSKLNPAVRSGGETGVEVDDGEGFRPANALERAALSYAGAGPGDPEGPRPVFIGADVLYREYGPTADGGETVVDRPAKVIGLRTEDRPRSVDLVVFSPERFSPERFSDSGSYVASEVLESGASPAAATIGDEPPQGTWRWPGGCELTMPSGPSGISS